MSKCKWKYDGYTKVKVGTGRNARMVEKWIYLCPFCDQDIRIERTVKLPMTCPSCGADMREGSANE